MDDELMKIYPELLWLTGDVNATPEGVNAEGEKYKEYNRTMLSIELLNYAIAEDYEKFTECQKPKKLSRENFKEICNYTKSIAKTEKDIEAMVAYLLINDLGKIKSIVHTIQAKIGLQTVDHDDILYQGLEKIPGISPTFDKLDERCKKLILNGLRTKFNMGQFIQSENLPQSLEPLINLDEDSFNYYLLHVFYDIGGATGHVTRKGSMIIDDDFWNKYKTAEWHLKQMKSKEDILPAYLGYLKDRGKILKLEEEGKDTISAIKLCNMLRTSDPEKAKLVLETLQKQEPNIRAILNEELTATGIDQDNAILLYYAPATMTNAISYFKNNHSKNPIEDGLNTILPIFARAYCQTRANIAKESDVPNVTTVMMSEIAKKAGEDPNELAKCNLRLERIGEDFEASLIPINQISNTKVSEFPITDKGNTVVIGMGGGSDCIQAAILARILKQKGVNCNNVISIRTNKTTSQDSKGNMGQERTVTNPAKVIDNDIYLISSKTTGSGRFLENIPADELNVYLVIDREDGNLKQKIKKAMQDMGDVKNVIGIDTGGDMLYPLRETENQAITTPDQDRRVLEAINSIEGIHKKCCIIGIGIDSPDCADTILKNARASYFELDEQMKQGVLDKYTAWDMNGENEKRFGKTPLAWQQALKGKTGVTCVNIPTKYVLDKKNPWIPFINIQSVTKGIFFMDTEKCLNAIREQENREKMDYII